MRTFIIKNIKAINVTKNIMLSISCIAFLLSAVSIESASFGLIAILAFVAIVSAVVGAFLERIVVVCNPKKSHSAMFTFNHINDEVIKQYRSWLSANYLHDTKDNFVYFCNKYTSI